MAHPPNRFRNAAVALLLVLAIWALSNWLSTARHIFDWYVAVPVQDYWRVPEDLKSILAHDPRFLWRQHNEHRILFPELVYAADMLFAHGRRILPLVVSFACYFTCWLLLAWAFLRESALPRLDSLAAISLAGVIIAFPASALSLADPFLLQWTLLESAALLALFLLGRSAQSRSWAGLSYAIAAAVIATYSSGNGLLLWPVLILCACLLRLGRQRIALLALAGVLFDCVYFVHYRFSGDLHWSLALRHPLYLSGFVLTYLSMPFGNMKSPHFCLYLGALHLISATALFAIAARRRLASSNLFPLLAGFYLFTLLSALLTAAGRLDPNDNTFDAARAPRYLTMPLLNWAVLILLAVWISGRIRPRLEPAAILILSLGFLIGSAKLRSWLSHNEAPFISAQVAELALDNDILDPRILEEIFPSPAFVVHFLKDLKEHRLSIYYRPGLGESQLGEAFHPGPSQIPSAPAAQVSQFPVEAGAGVIGSLVAPKTDERARVILIDQHGTVVGFGRRFPSGWSDDRLLPGVRVPANGWLAFVNSKYAAHTVSAYLIGPGGAGLLRLGLYEVAPAH